MSAPEKLYPGIIAILWIVWVLFWRVSALRTKTTEEHESAWSRASHIIPLVIGAVLIGIPSVPPAWLHRRVLADPLLLYIIGTAFVAAGLGFSIWARRHLGSNWSATITLKEDHELVRSGPYRFVRHPIYTGILVAFVGSALVRGEWRAAVAVAIAFAALWRKLRLEERWLEENFGAAYASYRAEVAALIPFVL